MPYLVNASEFPLPDELLNNSTGVFDPQFSTSEFQNQTIYELVYDQETPGAHSFPDSFSIEYLDGRYDPAKAVCILNRTGCGANATNLPIYWGAPSKVFALGNNSVLQGAALGSSGGLVATAFSTNNHTRVLYSEDFGQSPSWTNPTPTPIPGIHPRLSVTSSAIFLTTVSATGGVYATVFHLPTMPPPTPINVGGFHPLFGPPPHVSSVSPFYGSSGTFVQIYGSNFNTVTAVKFGSYTAGYTVDSSSHITATAPSAPPTSPLNITVTATGGTSATDWPYDWFTPSSTPAAPQVFSVVPNYALPNSTIGVVGYGFVSTATLHYGTKYLGGVATLFNDTTVSAIVPWGAGGPVDLEVNTPGGTSSAVAADKFTFATSQSILPRALDASPIQLTNGANGSAVYDVFATDTNSSSTKVYNSSNGGASYTPKTLAGYSASYGSAIFAQIGSTRIFLGGGVPGQVATVGFNQTIFALFTSNLGNRTIVETEGSSDGGQIWDGPYYSAPYAGSVQSPYATISPSGDVYVTWVDNGAGPGEVDQAVYSESGQLLLGPQVIPGSGGPAGYSALDPTVAVDGLDRPLYVWGWTNRTSCSIAFCTDKSDAANVSIDATGAFLTAKNAVSELSNAFNRTVPTDYIPSDFLWSTSQSQNLTPFRTHTSARIGWVASNLSAAASTCVLQTLALRDVLPYVSSLAPHAAFYGVSGHCSISPAANVSQIAPLAGATSANTFLGVYADWLLEALGYGSLREPTWAVAPSESQLNHNYKVHAPTAHYPPNQVTNLTGTNWHVSVTPESLNPDAIYLDVSGFFGSAHTGGVFECDVQTQQHASHLWWTYPTWVNETVKIHQTNGAGIGTFHPAGWMPSPYLTALPSGFFGTYNVTLNVTYQEFESAWNSCNNSSADNFNRTEQKFTLSPHYLNLSLVGNMTTYLEGLPADLQVHDEGNTTAGDAILYAAWNNSVLANYTEWTNASGVSDKIVSNPDTWSENTGEFTVPAGRLYSTSANLVSVPGGYNATGWSPLANTSLVVSNASAERFNATTPWTCSYDLPASNPLQIYSNAQAVTGVTTSNATLTWWSNYNGYGWATFNDSEDGAFTVQAQAVNLTAYRNTSLVPNWLYPVMYRVQLHDLDSWALYRATLGVSGNRSGTFSGGGSCLTFSNTVRWHFHTISLFSMEEQDLAYDSITQQGGGAQFDWSIPTAFASVATYQNGTMTYCQWWTNRTPAECGPGTNVTVPLPAENGELPGAELASVNYGLTQVNNSFILNVTGLTLNTTYGASLELNFTYEGFQFNASSRPLVFGYEKDTSGDGLTDWEKIYGWEVTTQTASGAWNVPFWVTANPKLQATNGLTSDYVEKEFGLNPATVDTANSHMLDTWNLTFDLGPKTQPLRVPFGANFEYWYEDGNNSTDYSWNKSCQYYVPQGCGAGSLGAASSNVYSNISGSDSSAWAARVMWSRAALESFINLSGVRNAGWLRATLGNATNQWTLTVSGKLSWGANPLATSTPGDGVADGMRVNPLYDEDLVISSVSAYLNSGTSACPDPGSGSYFGWATQFYVNHSRYGTVYSELPTGGNFSRQGNDTHVLFGFPGQCSDIKNYQVAIPIAAVTQNQTLQARLVLHYTAGGANQLWAEKFNGTGTSETTATVNFDTVSGRGRSYNFSGYNGSLSLSLSVMPSGVRATTFLWQPTDNSTLNSLPWGLKRYTGEQAFDLIEVNSSGRHSAVIPYAQNSSRDYSLTLPSGISNILVPRSEFLYSPLGQAILLGKNVSWTNSSATVPLLNTSADRLIGGYGSATNPLRNLACYWQNRSINNNASGPTGAICTGAHGESGTPTSSNGNVATVVSKSPDQANTGGVPGDPSLENATDEGAAIQSILTLNVTNNTGLILLLAGLLDNTSGGINGTLLSVTYSIPALGLNSVVVDALANETFNSSGLFGGPVSHWVAPPAPPCTSAFCWASNLVSGIVSIGTQFFSYVWSAATATATFIDDHLPTWLKNLGGQLATRIGTWIQALGSVLAAALAILTEAVTVAVEKVLSVVVNPLARALEDGGASGFGSLINLVTHTSASNFLNGTGTPVSATGPLASAMENPLLIAVAFGTAAEVALTLGAPLELGASFLVPVIFILIQEVFAGTSLLSINDKILNQFEKSSESMTYSWAGLAALPQLFYNLTYSPGSTSLSIQPVTYGGVPPPSSPSGRTSPAVTYDWWSYLGLELSVLAGFSAVSTVGFEAMVSTNPVTAEVASTIGLVVAFITAMVGGFAALISLDLPASCTASQWDAEQYAVYQDLLISITVLGSAAGLLGFASALFSASPPARVTGVVSLGLGMAVDATAIGSLRFVASIC